MGYGSHSLANSFNKSLYSSILGESMKDGYLSIYNDEMTNTFTKKKLEELLVFIVRKNLI